MLIVLNIGNTNIQAGVFGHQGLLKAWSLSSLKVRTSDSLGIALLSFLASHKLSPKEISGMALCSVVPPLTQAVLKMGKKYFHRSPFVVLSGINTHIPIKCRRPREVGADRIANAVAGHRKYQKSLIIVDCGTATTVDYISPKGEFMGGAIAPGIGMLAEALYTQTAQLPRIEIATPVIPTRAIGKDTISAMGAGVFFGYLGLVEELVERIRREARGRPLIIATGGTGRIVVEKSKAVSLYDEFLTLEGVRDIYEDNQS